ncbi:MAG: cell envelope integrity protein TolA [Phycisphaeraceae bacterium]|nr:cell envelope integrity protein TolA [Phycisphaeraceae bacterium]
MSRFLHAGWLVVVLGLAGPAELMASDERLQQLEQRLMALEKQRQADQQRIAELEARLADSGYQSHHGSEAEREATRNMIDAMLADQPTHHWGEGRPINIAAYLDFGGSLSDNDDNERHNRFNLREVEISFTGPVTSWADAAVMVALAEEIEAEDGEVEIEHHVELEEAYLNVHTLPVEGLSLRGGKFRNAFGVNNLYHTHDLPQVTRPLAVEAFLGHEGLRTVGFSARYQWEHDLAFVAEVVNSDGGEEPVLLGDGSADNPAAVGRIVWRPGDEHATQWQIGGSYLFGRRSEDSDLTAQLFGADLGWTGQLPEGLGRRDYRVQAEAFWSQVDFADADSESSFGTYVYGEVAVDPKRALGLRVDYTEFPGTGDRSAGDLDWAITPYFTWMLAPHFRSRLAYQHRQFETDGDWEREHNLMLQFTIDIGAPDQHDHDH